MAYEVFVQIGVLIKCAIAATVLGGVLTFGYIGWEHRKG